MTVFEAFSKTVNMIKKYCDSRYIKYEDSNLNVNYVTPQDYGAGGKGFTDDTAAINQAIAENDIIYFPSGTYNISSPILIEAQGKKIYGAKNAKIILKNCDGIVIKNPTNLELSDLQFIGDKSEHHGIVIDGSGYKCHFTNLSVRDLAGDGFHTNWYIGGFGVCTIEKCKFHYCRNGIWCLSDAADQRNNITITSNQIYGTEQSAVRATGCAIIVENNNIEQCQYAVRIDNWEEVPDREGVNYCGTTVVRITGNYIEAATEAVFSFASSYEGNPETGYKMDGRLDGVIIESNLVFNSVNTNQAEDFNWVEFISYARYDAPSEEDPSEYYKDYLVGDVIFAGNVFNTNRWPLRPLVDGGNLLTRTCRFNISRVSRGSCINMGEAVIVRDSEWSEDTGGIHENSISITDDGNGNVIIL